MEAEYASQEYKEQEKLIPDQVKKLRKILQEKHNIIVPAHCDDLVARCIRMKDGNLESAIKLIKGYPSASESFPKWDAIFQPSHDKKSYKNGTMMVISQRESEGRIVSIGRPGMWDPDTETFDQAMACIWMLLHYITAMSKDTQWNGIVTVWDCSGISMKQILAVNKWRIPFMVRIIQNGLIGRIKEIHIINHSKVASMFYSTLIKPFLKEKLKKRIIFHDDLESFHSRFDKSGLPTFAGGDQEVEECMDWNLMNEFLSNDQYYIDMMNDKFPRY